MWCAILEIINVMCDIRDTINITLIIHNTNYHLRDNEKSKRVNNCNMWYYR